MGLKAVTGNLGPQRAARAAQGGGETKNEETPRPTPAASEPPGPGGALAIVEH